MQSKLAADGNPRGLACLKREKKKSHKTHQGAYIQGQRRQQESRSGRYYPPPFFWEPVSELSMEKLGRGLNYKNTTLVK